MTGNVLEVVRLPRGQDIASPAVPNFSELQQLLQQLQLVTMLIRQVGPMISLALRYVSAWVEQRVKIPLHADAWLPDSDSEY